MKPFIINKSKLYYILLVAGFLGVITVRFADFGWINGLISFTWLFIFTQLTVEFTGKKERLINLMVFCLGNIIRYFGILGNILISAIVFAIISALIYTIWIVYDSILKKYTHWYTTLALPVIWSVYYWIAVALRFPTPFRIDVMFVDMQALIQVERVIGSFGLSFVMLWIVALCQYAWHYHKRAFMILPIGIFASLMLVGIIGLYPNIHYTNYVTVAYTTGPYVGDFINYTSLQYNDALKSVENSIADAANKGAEILIFNEEAFEISDLNQESFLQTCSSLAKQHHIYVLVGLDILDTDQSNDGKSENKLIWIDHNGEITGQYTKTKLLPLLESNYIEGNGQLCSHIIDVANQQLKISYLICYDSNFTDYVSQIDEDTDILFLPSWDWSAVSTAHGKLCRTLALENHASIIKPTYDGLTLAIDPCGKVIYSASSEDTGYEQVCLVEVPVKTSTDYIIAEASKSVGVWVTIGIEVVSLLVCIILLYGTIFETNEHSEKKTWFILLLHTDMLALIMDGVSWIFEGCENLDAILYGSTGLSMLLSNVLMVEFMLYIAAYIRERSKMSKKLLRFAVLISSVGLLWTAIGCLNGKIFYYENGIYHEGPLYSLYVFVNGCVTVPIAVMVAKYGKKLGIHDSVAIISYVILPGISVLISIVLPGYSLLYPAATLSLALVYVMLQSEKENKLELERQISSYHARHDELIGLLNRRACDEKLNELAEMDQQIGVAFADVNGLKYANDHYGHEAGDRLLIQFATVLGVHFRKEEIYRISGDEFLVLLPGMSEEMFEQRFAKLSEDLMVDGQEIACIGKSYGKCKDVMALIKEAESMMYVQKEEFHANHPELSR